MDIKKGLGEIVDVLNKINRSIIAKQDESVYGEIYYHDGGVDTVSALQDTWYQILVFDKNGESHLATPDHTEDHITISEAGKYLVIFSTSSRSAAANLFELMIKTNNGANDFENICSKRVTSTAGRCAGSRSSGICEFAVGDTIELWLQRLDGGAAAKTLTFETLNLSIVKIG